MTPARAVRIARIPSTATERAVRVPLGGTGARGPNEPPSVRAGDALRPNRGATRRAVRLAIAYAVAVGVLFAVLAALAAAATAGAGPGGVYGVQLLGLVALLLGLAGVLLSLRAAPRSVRLRDGETVIVGRFGQRRVLPSLDRLDVRVVRRYPTGWLSDTPVQLVEIAPAGTARRSVYLLDEGLLEPVRP